MAGHPDQELLSGLVHGIRFQAEIDEQFVMLSHLWSLAMAFDSVQSEIRRPDGFYFMQLRARALLAHARHVTGWNASQV